MKDHCITNFTQFTRLAYSQFWRYQILFDEGHKTTFDSVLYLKAVVINDVWWLTTWYPDTSPTVFSPTDISLMDISSKDTPTPMGQFPD